MIVCIVSSSSLEEVQRYSSNNDGSLTRKPQVTHIPRVMSVRSVVIVRQNRIPCQICKTLAHHGLAPFDYMIVYIQNVCYVLRSLRCLPTKRSAEGVTCIHSGITQPGTTRSTNESKEDGIS